MSRHLISSQFLIFILALSISNSAFASSSEVLDKTMEACLSSSTGLELCTNLRNMNQQISEFGQRTAKELGLDGTAGAVIASSTQALVERRVRFNTVVQGANGNIQVSPDSVALGLQWTF